MQVNIRVGMALYMGDGKVTARQYTQHAVLPTARGQKL